MSLIQPDGEPADPPDPGAILAQGMGLMGQVLGGTIPEDEAETAGLAMLAQICTVLPTDQLVSMRALINSTLHDRGVGDAPVV